MWKWVDGHDGFVYGFARHLMSQGRVLGHVLPGAAGLVMRVGRWAGCTGVPNGDVESARIAVIVVIESFVGIRRATSAAVSDAWNGPTWNIGGGEWRHVER